MGKRGGDSRRLRALVEWAAMKESADSAKNARSKKAPSRNAEPAIFGAHSARPEPRNWIPLLVGFGLVLGVLAVVAILGHGKKEVATTADSYSPMLVVDKATLSQADNFVGSTITYIDLTVHNNGDRTVVGGTVQAVFRDSLGRGGADGDSAAARAGASPTGRPGRSRRSGAGAARSGADARAAPHRRAHLQPVEPGSAGAGIPRPAIQVAKSNYRIFRHAVGLRRLCFGCCFLRVFLNEVKNPSSIQIGITARKALQPMNLDVAVEMPLGQPRRLERR